MQAASTVNYIRLNHFRHHWPLGCAYKDPPVPTGYLYLTSRNDSDVEHDWWRSVRLLSRLTGDKLLRCEFLDHSRIFTDDNGRVMYYRSHAKGLEENALALSMARFGSPPCPDDPCTGASMEDTLRYKLEKRLKDWFAKRYDTSRLYETEGWVVGEGTLLPGTLGNPWTDPRGFPYWGMFTYMDRGVRHDGCYDCLDPTCRSAESQPYGRRTFHEWLMTSSLGHCLSVLPQGGPLGTEAFLRLSQLGFSTMSMLHWAGQPNPCSTMPYLPAYAKQGDAAHVWLRPPCPDPGYIDAGPFQPRYGDGHLGYPYASEAARAVILQYAWTNQTEALAIACTKFHEVLAAQRFRRTWGDPCSQFESYQNTYFPVNIDDPGHWAFLSTLMTYGLWFVRADFPAYNPEDKYYH
jgi:hypothetical protein